MTRTVRGRLITAIVLGLLCWGPPVAARIGPTDQTRVDDPIPEEKKKEYALKAAYLYNFATFVTWPDERFEDEEDPIVLGILGDDPFGKILDDALAKRRVGKRPFDIRRFDELEGLEACHILFLSTSRAEDIEESIEPVRGAGVLVVSEMDGVLGKGGVINFYIEKKTIRFEIQVDEAEREGLDISSKLLRLARIVRDDDEESAEGPR